MGNGRNHIRAIHSCHTYFVPFRQQRRVARQQQAGQKDRDFFVYHRIAADGVAGGQHQAIAGMFNFWPHQAGRVYERHMVVQVKALLVFGDGRLVADQGHAPFQQRIDQRGLAHIGDAHNHHAQRLEAAAAVRRQRRAQAGHLGYIARFFARQRHRFDIFLCVVKIEPGLGCGGVSQIGLIEDFQARALTVQAQFLDQRVAARLRHARIQHFNHYINTCHGLGRFLARRGHVSGKPLNCHCGVTFTYENVFYLDVDFTG